MSAEPRRRINSDRDDPTFARRANSVPLLMAVLLAGAGVVLGGGAGLLVGFAVGRATAKDRGSSPASDPTDPKAVGVQTGVATATPVSQPKNEPPIVFAGGGGSEILFKTFADNEAAGDAKYTGRVVEFQYGGEIRKTAGGYLFVGVDRPNTFTDVRRGIYADPSHYIRTVVVLRADQAGEAAKVGKDQQIIVRGRVVGQRPTPGGRNGTALHLTDGVIVGRLQYNHATGKYDAAP